MNTTTQIPAGTNIAHTDEGPISLIPIVAKSGILNRELANLKQWASLAQSVAASMLAHVIIRRLQSENLWVDQENRSFHNWSFLPFTCVPIVRDPHKAARVVIEEISGMNTPPWRLPDLRWTVGVPFLEEGDGKSEYWRVVGYGPKEQNNDLPHDLNKHARIDEIQRCIKEFRHHLGIKDE